MNLATKTIAALACASLSVSASAMTVKEFLPKAEKLMSMGPAAMLSSDRKPVIGEMEKVAKAYRADVKASRKSGKSIGSCPPKKGSVDGKQFLKHLQSIPASQRGMQVKTAFYGYMAKKYPC